MHIGLRACRCTVQCPNADGIGVGESLASLIFSRCFETRDMSLLFSALRVAFSSSIASSEMGEAMESTDMALGDCFDEANERKRERVGSAVQQITICTCRK